LRPYLEEEPVRTRAIDLTTVTREMLGGSCSVCTWWQSGNHAPAPAGDRLEWERAVEAEAGFFGRALLDGDAVLGWMLVAPAALVPRAHRLPAGPPSPDAYLLLCSYFYDEEYLHGFQTLLQEIEASLKVRRVAALEAFAACASPPEDRFRGYLRELNLFNREVLEGSGFRPVFLAGQLARYRLELGTVIAVPRRSQLWEELEVSTAPQPI
jgi:hypothetical protein